MGGIQQEGFISQYKWYILGSILLLALFYLRGKYKKKKLTNPKFKLKDLWRG